MPQITQDVNMKIKTKTETLSIRCPSAKDRNDLKKILKQVVAFEGLTTFNTLKKLLDDKYYWLTFHE